MNYIDFEKYLDLQFENFQGKAAKVPFFYNGKPLEFLKSGNPAPKWGLTTRSAGTMRFRWNEKNENREFLKTLFEGKKICPIELIHSKKVYYIEEIENYDGIQGDGLLTGDKNFIPSVTVADCVPIFVLDIENEIFGALHSGWKGTGIVAVAVEMMKEKFGSSIENICVAIGPHIEENYFVNEERAKYFIENFGSKCVQKIEGADNTELNWKLSLLKANLLALEKIGFNMDNVVAAKESTSTSRDKNGNYIFGSCRRETEGVSGIAPEEFSKLFSVNAGFVGF